MGEGGLVFFTLTHSVFYHQNIIVSIFEFLLSFLVLTQLYGFNDYIDCEMDLNNDKKNKVFVRSILANKRLFLSINTVLAVFCMIGTFVVRGYIGVLFVMLVFVVNYTYSIKAKSFPIVDLLTVMLWGGCFILTSGVFQLHLWLLAGVMTGIAHLFQMITDRRVDEINDLKTSVVYFAEKELIMLSILSILLGVVLYLSMGCYWALSCIIPFLVYYLSNKVVYAWHISRVYFFICWVGLLTSLYGFV